MTGAAQSSGRAPPDESQAGPLAPAARGRAGSRGSTGVVPPRGMSDSGVAKPPTFCDVVGPFVQNRLPDLVDLLMVLVVIGSVAAAVLNRSFMVTNGVLAGSTASAAFCFLLASRSLRRCEGVGYERMFVAACAMAGGIMLYELLYHFGWPDSWRVFGQSLTTFGLDLPRRGAPFSVLWAVMAFSTVFVGARYMRANRWFCFVGAMGAGLFLLWVAVGYPNYFEPRRWPESTLVIPLIPPVYAHPTNPGHPGWGVVSAWGAMFATAAPASISSRSLRSNSGGCWKSASITPMMSPRATFSPSTTAVPRPSFPGRWTTVMLERMEAMVSARLPVPSGLLSSTMISSKSVPSSARKMASTSLSRFSRSLYVAMMTENLPTVRRGHPLA